MANSRDRSARIYHFTHLDNLPSIVAAAGLAAGSVRQRADVTTDVGDADVKAARRRRVVPVLPGGTVADYVPFYFAPRSPMMYRIACDHRDGVPGRYSGGDDPLVYLVSSVDRVLATGLAWVASDGNAAAAVSRFTNRADDLATFVDWPLMAQTIWSNTEADPDRQRRRMAELLVHQELPLTAVLGFATRTGEQAQEVRAILSRLGEPNRYVAVRAAWYYGYRRREVRS
jgi:hypothetical protein